MNRAQKVKCNKNCRPSDEINILLLGSSGVGKTTFINAMVSYMKYDSLSDAVKNPLEALINSSFTYSDAETFDDHNIIIGEETKYEKFSTSGQAATQQSRSFVFPVGERNLRFIDTPGIGDARGLEKDHENFRDILRLISQYEHLNGVCILVKPQQPRLDILFQFCVNELLRHLHTDAKENLIFVFTHIRETLYAPGNSKKLVQTLLDKHKAEFNVEIPFSKSNTILLDNEPFRYLALVHNKIPLNDDDKASYSKSWEYSVREYARLMQHIGTLRGHKVRKTLSLNEVEQLIRRLPRPIAETARIIRENIELAETQKRKIVENPDFLEDLVQYDATIVKFKFPRTVCTSPECCRTVEIGGVRRTEYLVICHDECFLKGVQQETLNDPLLQDCSSIDVKSGECHTCGCSWERHKHITYDYQSFMTHIPLNSTLESGSDRPIPISIIDKHIESLRNEERKIKEVYQILSKFLRENSLVPINDMIVEYLKYFLEEAEQNRTNPEAAQKEVQRLTTLIKQYQDEANAMRESWKNGNLKSVKTVQTEDVYRVIEELYELPINGAQIRRQMEGIAIKPNENNNEREVYVELPQEALATKTMKALYEIMKVEN